MLVGTAHPSYTRHALAELRQLIGGGRAEPLADGVFLFHPSAPVPGWPEQIQAHPPVFLRHLHPVQAQVELAGPDSDLAPVLAAVRPLLDGLPTGAQVQVQVRRLGLAEGWSRFAVKEALDPVLAAAGLRPVTRQPDQIVSVTLAAGPPGSDPGSNPEPVRALIGRSTPAENLSPWPGGVIHYPREAVISRAGFKLLEALELFAPTGLRPVPGSRALDLGAAPGGWTQVLLDRGLAVTAVDPAPLDSRLLGRPGLTFLQQNAAAVEFPAGHFQLLTCDMNWYPLQTARLVAGLAPALAPGGWALVTVKLLESDSPTRTYRQVAGILAREGGLQLCTARQLFHNRDEITLLLRRAE